MIREKILDFLYDQVQKGMIPHIKKGMVEEIEHFISTLLEEQQVKQAVERMVSKKPQDDAKGAKNA